MAPLPVQDDGKNSEYGETVQVLGGVKAPFSDFNETVEIKRVIENTETKSIYSGESADENESSEGYNSSDGNVETASINFFPVNLLSKHSIYSKITRKLNEFISSRFYEIF